MLSKITERLCKITGSLIVQSPEGTSTAIRMANTQLATPAGSDALDPETSSGREPGGKKTFAGST